MPSADEIPIRNVLKKSFPKLSEEQIQGVLRRFYKLTSEGHAHDYSYVESIKRYIHHAKT